MTDKTVSGAAGAGSAFTFTANYRRYVLGILVVAYTFNYLDRQVLSILVEPIKNDLMLTDTQLGSLTGAVFAIFYATLGMPIAAWADRGNRRNIIALAMGTWSLMTALCGAATGYLSMAAARIGVAVGEAGGSPPSHSILSDYYPPESRATALAIYSLGVPLGILVGMWLGGFINDAFGWRWAFVVVGAPGVLLAIVVRYSLREPPRGFSEPASADTETPEPAPAFRQVAALMWKQKAVRNSVFGTTLAAFTGYAFVSWAPAFFVRSHGMSVSEVGTALGLIIGIAGGIGTFGGGYFADKLGIRDVRWRMWVVAIPIIIAAPFGFGLYLSEDTAIALSFMVLPALVGSFYLGPTLALIHSLVTVRMRSVASAILLFVVNIIGMGLGPLTVGILSDLLAPSYGGDSLRWALLIVGFANVWAGIHFFLAARHITDDEKRLEGMQA